jgi:Ni,Fe-hydrogenase III small subunit
MALIEELKILGQHGKQYIPDVTVPKLPAIFRGRPVITNARVDEMALKNICPTGAIGVNPVSIDLGKCVFCGECALAYPEKIKFTPDYFLSTNIRDRLMVFAGEDKPITLDADRIRKEITSLFGRSLKLREVCAAGANADEAELNASGNVNFDMGRFGIEFLASPRHCDGVVITGPISENMAGPLQICYDAIPHPKMVILAGTDAISGGIFSGSKALDRSFLEKYPVDLYVPGHPPHPLTFVNGVLALIRTKKKTIK